MDILICEDDIEQLYNLKKIIQSFQKISDFDLNILIASTKSEDLLPLIKSHRYNNGALFILDIFLEKSDLNGFELAKVIRTQDRISSIVFSTTHSEMTYMTFIYKVEALDYVLKDEIDTYQKRIGECLKIAYAKYELTTRHSPSESKFFFVKVGPKKIKILENEFLYAETSDNKHRIVVHTVNQQMEIYGTLSELENESEKIIRCHNSFIVNTDKIKLIDLNQMTVLLVNGQTCYLSRKYVNSIKRIMDANN